MLACVYQRATFLQLSRSVSVFRDFPYTLPLHINLYACALVHSAVEYFCSDVRDRPMYIVVKQNKYVGYDIPSVVNDYSCGVHSRPYHS